MERLTENKNAEESKYCSVNGIIPKTRHALFKKKVGKVPRSVCRNASK